MPPYWKVRLSEAAENDFNEIIVWTAEHFGIDQAHVYRDVILDALRALQAGPPLIGTRNLSGLPQELKALHVARKGKRGRHFIVFDDSIDGRIQALRILHDSMDIQSHVPSDQ